jgi:hypothetical protein
MLFCKCDCCHNVGCNYGEEHLGRKVKGGIGRIIDPGLDVHGKARVCCVFGRHVVEPISDGSVRLIWIGVAPIICTEKLIHAQTRWLSDQFMMGSI